MKTPARRHAFVALFGLLCVISLAGMDLLGFFTVSDARLTDKLIAPHQAASDIVIVAIDDKSIQQFGVWPWPRSLHADMVNKLTAAGAKTIGYDVTFSEASNPADDQAFKTAVEKSKRVVLASEGSLTPIPFFMNVAKRIGDTATLLLDPDGVARRVIVQESFANSVAGDENTTFNGDKTLRIPYVGPPGTFRVVSFADVLGGGVPDSFFKDNVVLVGATAADLHDNALTPESAKLMAGVEIQANIIQALREGRELHEFSPKERASLIIILAVIMTVLSLILRLRYLILATAALAIAYLLTAVGASQTDLLLPITAPLLLIVLVGGIDIVSRYLEEQGRRKFIHTAFAHYLAPAVIEKLVKGETKLELGGMKRELTIMFSDIRGFTSLSEKLKPEELVPFLNEYLTAMTDVVLDSEGVVDKYIGDAIMAFWGAPILQADHAIRAARTAVLMKRKLAELQAGWSKSGKPRIDIGIGLNTGEVLVGNMGSKQRFDYTVIGDDVNLASRLEGLTKQYGVTALVSEATRNKLGDAFVVRELDLVAVKGRTQPVKIFELIEESGHGDSATTDKLGKFEQALRLYREQRWDEATKIFESLAPTDKPSAIFIERIAYLHAHPPGTHWDGSFIAKEK